MRQVAQFHWEPAVQVQYIHAMVNRMDFNNSERARLGLNFFKHIGVGANEHDRLLVVQKEYIPFRRSHLVQVFERFPLAGGITVENEYDILAIRPLLDLAPDHSCQQCGRNVLHRIVFVHNHGSVVRKAGRKTSAYECKYVDGSTEFHGIL